MDDTDGRALCQSLPLDRTLPSLSLYPRKKSEHKRGCSYTGAPSVAAHGSSCLGIVSKSFFDFLGPTDSANRFPMPDEVFDSSTDGRARFSLHGAFQAVEGAGGESRVGAEVGVSHLELGRKTTGEVIF